ncbi:MAG: hypothetical protein TYPL_2230 [Candidatus Tyloplasma litorale]|nr:MAG: hypothetical protein TYPL_2230 [Mycoplasmatales bacterium]
MENIEEKVFEELKKLINKKYNKNVELNTVLNETGIDSLDLLDLVVEAEQENGVTITDDELVSMKTIEDVVKAISTKLK